MRSKATCLFYSRLSTPFLIEKIVEDDREEKVTSRIESLWRRFEVWYRPCRQGRYACLYFYFNRKIILRMKQADCFMDFVYDFKFCFSTIYFYAVAFDREAEDWDEEKKFQDLEVQ